MGACRWFRGIVAGAATFWPDTQADPVGVTDKVEMTPPQLRRRLGPLYCADWSSSTLPPSMTFSRTGTVMAINNAAQSAVSSFAANAWTTEVNPLGVRFFRTHRSIANGIPNPRAMTAAGWTTAGATAPTLNFTNGPDGSATADRFNIASGGFSSYRTQTPTSGQVQTFYTWVRATTATNNYQDVTDVGGVAAGTGALTTAWQRISLTRTGGGIASSYIPTHCGDFSGSGGTTAQARDVCHDMNFWYAGFYAPFYTDTSAGFTGLSTAGSTIISNAGWFDITLTKSSLVSKNAAADIVALGSDQYILYLDANNHFRFRVSDSKFVLTVGGTVKASSAAQSFGRDADLGIVRVLSRADGCGFYINGAGVTGTAGSALSPPATVYWGSNNASAGTFEADWYGLIEAETYL